MIPSDWRNQHTTLDAKKAKTERTGKCPCGATLLQRKGGKKKWCDDCSDKNRLSRSRAYYHSRKAASGA